MSEFRYNTLEKKWVLFAPNRALRPTEFSNDSVKTNKNRCPFEKGSEEMTPNELLRIGDKDNWKCRVVPNLYHALSIDDKINASREMFFEKRSGFGAHEVIIETPKHSHQMYDFNHEEFSDYLLAIKLRLIDLKKDARLKYFSIFKNSGSNAGATLEHSHSQLIAMTFLPPKIEKELEYFKEYKQHKLRDFFDDMIYEHKKFKKTILFENSLFIAFCPYASAYSFEVMIVSKNALSSIEYLKDEHIYALSEALEYVFERLRSSLGEFSFNMSIKNADVQAKKDESFNRFHIRIIPRLYKIAGFELDSDIFINTILPEKAVEILKD